MADETRAKLLDQVKLQGELVRKLKSAKAEGSRSQDLITALASIDAEFAKVSYVCGWTPTLSDKDLFESCKAKLNGQIQNWSHLKRWFSNIESYTAKERSEFPTAKEKLSGSFAEKIENLTSFSSKNNYDLDDKVRGFLSTAAQ